MKAPRICLLQVLLIAAATYGSPTTIKPQEAVDSNALHEPRALPPHPPLHEAVRDKPVHQPLAPRDATGGSIPCSNNSDCTPTMGPEAICHGNVCDCKIGSTMSPVSSRCLHESALGSGCDEDWQCTKPLGSSVSCKNHICTCNADAKMVNGKCWKQKHLTDKCSATEECIGGINSLCEENRCVCKPGMVPKPSNDKCLNVATKFGDPCEEAIQCTESLGSGSICNNSQCVCQDGYHYKNVKCMKNLILGDQCGAGVDGDCFLIHGMGVDHVDCIQNTCQCKGGLNASSDNQICLSQGQTDPGSGGGAESIQPLLITFVTIFFVRLLTS